MAAQRPKVRIVATGGSISGIGPHRLDYTLYPEIGRRMSIEEMLARIPEAQEIAEVQGENLIRVGSTAIGPQEWLQMAQRINQLFQEDSSLSGVVVTHGTATLEETAYFLHLTVKSERPVVVTGAMRPPTAVGTDADLNLLDAIRLAACPEAAGRGVLTVLNNEIQSARDVTKTNTFRVETFKSRELGFLGYTDSDGQVVFYRSTTRKHTTATPFHVTGTQVLPRVDIVYAYGGADGLLVDAVRQHGSEGMVLVGLPLACCSWARRRSWTREGGRGS
ncbi:MAG: asparaginase [Nitrospinae bacterium]|nr:asparaginase [Nitrospinota bacterium]